MCRDFKDDPVPEELVDRLIYAAKRAPSGGNINTRNLIVVQDRSVIHQMKLVSPGLYGTPSLAIVVCTDESAAQNRAIATFDAGAAAENIALAATSLGLGASYVKSYPEAAMKKILGLPEHLATEIIVTVGYPADRQPPPAKAPPTPVYANRYGNQTPSTNAGTARVEHDPLFELALYALTCARTVIDEPSRYGSRRLMETLERVLEIPGKLRDTRKDRFQSAILSELKQRTDLQSSSVVHTREYKAFLDHLIEKFVEELERKYATSQA